MFEVGNVLVIVGADGAGGLRGGGAASDALVAAVRTALFDVSFPPLDVAPWVTLLERVDANLSTGMAGETTGVIVVPGAQRLLGVSVGDSEALVVSATGVDDLTQGQDKARLGSGRARPVAFRRPGLEGMLVVGTDGLFGFAAVDGIATAVHGQASEQACELLVNLARLSSGRLGELTRRVVG